MSGGPRLCVETESWPVSGGFTISRGTKTRADVVVANLVDGGGAGRGECVPYPRYGESVEGVIAAIEALGTEIANGMTRIELQDAMPPGAARTAVDCAFWDLEAKRNGARAWKLAGMDDLRSVTTAYTLSLDTPEEMARSAADAASRPLLKLKLGGDRDAERLRAVRAAAPGARLIVDANEGWRPDRFSELMNVCVETAVELVEQPLPSDDDERLRGLPRPVAVCADESAHSLEDFGSLVGKYDAINIKLDKTGGLTEALALADTARDAGMTVMVGCMLATSLAMAPAMLVAQKAGVVDLDGPLLLDRDRDPAITFDGSVMAPPPALLWG